MGSTEGSSQFNRLNENHLAHCLALSAEAGWNQTIEDWALFLRHGTILGRLADRGVTFATGAVLPYPAGFAWISMVLVTASRRRKRIGSSILEACCAEVMRRGLLPMLDATSAGERIYRSLGFEGIFKMSRWQGETGRRVTPVTGIRTMAAEDIPIVTALDAAAFGGNRMFLVESLFRRLPQLAFVIQDITGFVLARPGRIATQIGPIVAANEDAAAALLDAALGRISGPVFLDLVDGRDIIKRHLQQHGFSVQRSFLRMGLNCSIPLGNPTRLFVVAGPEFG